MCYSYIVVCSLQDGAFLKIVKQLAHSGKINIQNSSINNNDYKSDEKVFILPKQCFSKYSYNIIPSFISL